MPPLVFSSRSAGLITTRSASGRMRKSAAILVVPPYSRTTRMRGRCVYHDGSALAWRGVETVPSCCSILSHILYVRLLLLAARWQRWLGVGTGPRATTQQGKVEECTCVYRV